MIKINYIVHMFCTRKIEFMKCHHQKVVRLLDFGKIWVEIEGCEREVDKWEKGRQTVKELHEIW